MSNLHADIEGLKGAIDALLVQFPELHEDDLLRADMFEAETELDNILSRLVEIEGDAETMVSAIKQRMGDLNVRAARYERRKEAMRTLILSLMERAGLSKRTLVEATLSLSFRKSAPLITDETALPNECLKVVKKPDLAVIKAWIEAGNIPDGVSLSNGKNVLSIRTK